MPSSTALSNDEDDGAKKNVCSVYGKDFPSQCLVIQSCLLEANKSHHSVQTCTNYGPRGSLMRFVFLMVNSYIDDGKLSY